MDGNMRVHNCPYCGRLLEDEVLYCSSCGGPQVYQTSSGSVRLQTLDPWVITDPQARQRFASDPTAVEALVNTWRNDPNHARTRQIQDEIDGARGRGYLERVAYYYCCPWAPAYRTKRDVTIGGKYLRSGEQFTFDVSAEGVETGEGFRREVLVGDFVPTEDVDYCLPGESQEED